MVGADASAIIQACLSEADVRPLQSLDLIGPPLLWSEATSVIHELRWRGQISTELAATATKKLSILPIRARRPASLYEEAVRIADRFGWAKTYDAEYVALARLSRCRLLTIDARMAAAVASLVEVMGPSDVARWP